MPDTAADSDRLDPQRVLITGAQGVVWSNSRTFMPPHRRYTLTDRADGQLDGQPVKGVDILDYPAVLEAIRGHDAVVHLAIASQRALEHLPRHQYDDEFLRVNCMGTQHVMQAAVEAGVKRLVYFSSLTVHLGPPRDECVTDDSQIRTCNLYAVTKLFGEHLAEYYHRMHNLSVISYRLGQPYPLKWLSRERLESQRGDFEGSLIAFEDIARGVEAGLTTPIRHGVGMLVSASDRVRFDSDNAHRFGYRPVYHFEGSTKTRLDNSVSV